MARSKLLMLSVPAVHGGQAAVTPWYLAGGVSAANCLAAYQAIGAASLAESYVNQANPGTYDLSGGTAPTWTAETGWTFNGSTQYKDTGINPAANATQNCSIIARFSGVTGNTGMIIGSGNAAGSYYAITPYRADAHKYYNGGSLGTGAGSAAGIIGMAGLQGYFDGVADGLPATWGDWDSLSIYIGGVNNYGYSLGFAGNVLALAIYDKVLTATQMLAISNALEALPGPFDPTNPAFPGPTRPFSGEFMLAWFSDPHVGTWVAQSEIGTMTAYLKNHATRLGIEAVIFGGDYADSPDHAEDRAVFVAAMPDLEDIPHLMAIGNHDYDYPGVRAATIHNGVFGQSYYTEKSWWSGGFYEAGHSENAYLLLTIGAVDYIFISVEFFPRDAVMTWLDGLLTTHAARKAIIITHAYEYSDGSVYAEGDGFGPDIYTEITDTDYNWGTDMWNTIKTHDNVILVHSGHVTSTARHSANSDGGQPVNQVLQNFQGDSGYENSMMRFMTFNPTTETIRVETFSPVTLAKLTAAANQFTLTY